MSASALKPGVAGILLHQPRHLLPLQVVINRQLARVRPVIQRFDAAEPGVLQPADHVARRVRLRPDEIGPDPGWSARIVPPVIDLLHTVSRPWITLRHKLVSNAQLPEQLNIFVPLS